jgi:hypothetical protein
MDDIDKMSNDELRIALATEGPRPMCKNVRVNRRGDLVGDFPYGISERPVGIPNWPTEVEDARFLEDAMKTHGLHEKYLHNLAEIMQSDAKVSPKPSARQMSEAALMTLREAAACVA